MARISRRRAAALAWINRRVPIGEAARLLSYMPYGKRFRQPAIVAWVRRGRIPSWRTRGNLYVRRVDVLRHAHSLEAKR